MTRVVRVLTRVLTVIVVVASGTYLIVYLYRWEWNRALVAGIFFVAAEIAIVGALLMGRIERLERRMGPRQQAAASRTQERLREVPSPTPSFSWLREPPEGTNVFVPVLLGAGVLLSGLAQLVQRLASSTVDPLADRVTSLHLAHLEPPEGGLVPPPAGDRVPPHLLLDDPPRPETPRGWRLTLRALAVVLASGLVAAGIDVLADATQARPDADLSGYVTVIELEVADRAGGRSPRLAAEALWVSCRPRLPVGTSAVELVTVEEGVVRLTLEPALGDTGERRFRGCLEDATIDLIDAHLLEMWRLPASQLTDP